MKRLKFPVLLTSAEQGSFVVTCRDLPPLITQGEDEADAITQAVDAMDEVLATAVLDAFDLPVPSKPRRLVQLVWSKPSRLRLRLADDRARMGQTPSVCLGTEDSVRTDRIR